MQGYVGQRRYYPAARSGILAGVSAAAGLVRNIGTLEGAVDSTIDWAASAGVPGAQWLKGEKDFRQANRAGLSGREFYNRKYGLSVRKVTPYRTFTNPAYVRTQSLVPGWRSSLLRRSSQYGSGYRKANSAWRTSQSYRNASLHKKAKTIRRLPKRSWNTLSLKKHVRKSRTRTRKTRIHSHP